ncbi:hypothetical protein OAE57_01065 [Synechococcus sp. AH-551-C10]|nr:hypothetical protein [Synechococcus sp. AH-551-C10]MDB4659643.1 hypothetical protein [Synechococcus sp. AH-551-C10]
MLAKKSSNPSVSQKDLLRINRAAFESFDKIFAKVELDLDLVSCFVFCDSWLRGDYFPPAIETYVKNNFDIRPSRTILSRLGLKYRKLVKSIRWVYFILNVLVFDPHQFSQIPICRNIMFINIKRFGRKPADEIEKMIGEPVTQLDLKSNISSPSYVGSFETAVTRKLVFLTLEELLNVIGRRRDCSELTVSAFEIFCGLLTKNAAYSFLKSASTKRVIITGSLTNPHVRRIFFVCQLLDIRSFLYISRNISPVSIPMLAGMHNAIYGIPSKIFTKNVYSMRTLNNKLNRDSTLVSSLISIDDCKPVSGKKCSYFSDLLFLLSTDKYFNYQLINFLINNLDFSDFKGNIVIRLHPLDDRKDYEDFLAELSHNISFSDGGPLSNDLSSKRVCYLYPSEAFSEILEKEIPICWMMMNCDLQAMENIFWTSICGDVVNDFSELVAHSKKIFDSRGAPSKLELDLSSIESLRSTREPYRLIGGRLGDDVLN